MTEASQTRGVVIGEKNTSIWPCIYSVVGNILMPSKTLCLISRLAAIFILFVSLVCLVLNIRFLIRQRRKYRRDALVISLFVSSLLVLLISVPGVIIQLFSCKHLCIPLYCRIEGFVSYTSGCVCMLVLTSFSVHRYLSLCQYNVSSMHIWFSLGCWIFSIIWTLPPLLGWWSFYVPEGLGFHCSLHWEDASRLNRLYIFFSFFFVYLTPLIILFAVNLRVHNIVRTVYSTQNHLLNPFNQHRISQQTSSLLCPSSSIHRQNAFFDNHSRHRSSADHSHTRAARERRRLRTEHRFLRAIVLLVGAYVFAWTPYAIIALVQLFRISMIFRYPWMVTLSALIAKSSVILSPLAYVGTVNSRLLKTIIFNPTLKKRKISH